MLSIHRILKVAVVCLVVNLVTCSIDGLSYMDPNKLRPLHGMYPRGEDPCNPLYWYPRNIPEYCQYRNIPLPTKPIPSPLPMPLPVPVQPPPLMPMPLPAPVPVLPPLPYGVPIVPTNPMVPVAPDRLPYIYPEPSYSPAFPFYNFQTPSRNLEQVGMVPGLPGLVSPDNGINILPFSDAYTNMLENHKNKMIRRRLQELIREYEDFPSARSFRMLRKFARRTKY